MKNIHTGFLLLPSLRSYRPARQIIFTIFRRKRRPPLSSASLTGASMSQKRGCESVPVPPGTEDADLPDVKKK